MAYRIWEMANGPMVFLWLLLLFKCAPHGFPALFKPVLNLPRRGVEASGQVFPFRVVGLDGYPVAVVGDPDIQTQWIVVVHSIPRFQEFLARDVWCFAFDKHRFGARPAVC